MRRVPRYSPATRLVLEYFVAAPSQWCYGYQLMTTLDLSSGTLYPVLIRLTDARWLQTRWDAPTKDGRPPRHLYRLAAGAAPEARAILSKWAARTVRDDPLGTAT